MKKRYSAPTLSSYGAVEELTQAFGSGSRSDFFYLGTQQLASGQYGSKDYNVVPRG
jgi:hypothetical protein